MGRSTDEQPQVANLAHVDVDRVQAELVRMHQSSAREIAADEVELHQSISVDVNGSHLSAHESALGMVNAVEVQMQNSGAAALRAQSATINGYTGAVIAGQAQLGNTYAGLVAAQDVKGERIESIVLLARRVEGDVRTIVDTRTALLAGLVGGLFTGMIFLLGQALFRRKD
jgi:hypothetical protein